uniref:Putative cytochrome P450 n=1 Tax=Puccinia horiana TaxID=331382 RepID=W8FPW7_9BASI|nr:putative cytochrome P450 [Puccinia horiana]
MPGLRLVDVSKPEWLEHIQKTNFQNYVKGSLFHSVMTDVFGNGIFVTDGRQIKSACETLHRYSSSLIDERLASFDLGAQAYEETPTDLLGFFLRIRKELDGDLVEQEIKDAFLNLIIAGRDSTGEALTWAFYHLMMNKDLVAKIREEASQITGQDRAGHVTYENNKEFKWAHAVVLEALRLHPSIPKNIRFALKPDKIPGGPVIEAGDAVRWSDWSIARDPEVWGEDCLEFRPARWIDENGNIKQFSQFKFHAFNGGPRVCLGMNFAIFQFDLEYAPEWLKQVPNSPIIGDSSSTLYQTPTYKPSLTLPMAHPIMVTIKAYHGRS